MLNKYNQILIALDFTYMDTLILEYLSHLVPVIEPTKLYFVHVEPNLEVIKNIEPHFQEDFEGIQALDEKLKELMKVEIEKYLPSLKNMNVSYDVLEGSPIEQLIHWSKVKQSDLVIVGKKRIGEGSGIISKKLARNIGCSVLFIPEDAKHKIENILVPIDFSSNSGAAVEEAVRFAKKLNIPGIQCLHVYDVPTAHYRTLRTYDQFSNFMLENAKEGYTKFIKAFEDDRVNFEESFAANKEFNIAKHINRYAVANELSMIIIGAKGHSRLEQLMLGSVTEKLLVYNDTAAILVIKK